MRCLQLWHADRCTLRSPAECALQVELNTIASSFGCLSTLVARMHRYLLGRLGASPAELAALPEHNAMDAIVDAMGAAVADYGTPGVEQAGEAESGVATWCSEGLLRLHANPRWHSCCLTFCPPQPALNPPCFLLQAA